MRSSKTNFRRLRSALESQPTRSWLDNYRNGNRILFGRYTGQTPVSGAFDAGNTTRLRKNLKKMNLVYNRVAQSNDAEIKYYFQDMDGGEMWSRLGHAGDTAGHYDNQLFHAQHNDDARAGKGHV